MADKPQIHFWPFNGDCPKSDPRLLRKSWRPRISRIGTVEAARVGCFGLEQAARTQLWRLWVWPSAGHRAADNFLTWNDR